MRLSNGAGIIVLALIAVGWLALRNMRAHAMLPGEPRKAGAHEPQYSESGHAVAPLSAGQIEALSGSLTADERRVILGKGTERPFTGALLDEKQEGTFTCRLCGLPLFESEAKFKSGTGWPSFFKPADPLHVHNEADNSLGMARTEITCARCSGHLGHVFNDGPAPTGLRYCVNSASLKFFRKGAERPQESRAARQQTAYFAGGCFWGIEDRFEQVPGVFDAVSGYQGGQTVKPTYRQVCSGSTGHAESVRVTFDPDRVQYRELLERFFEFHDATQLNRQGPDVGTQYRSAIFTTDDTQVAQAQAYISELQATSRYRGRKIVTRVEPATTFYAAEDYHQDYNVRHGRSCALPGS